MGVKDLFQQSFPTLAAQFELKDFQEQVIAQVLTKKNTLCIMPTGGGKSLIYWLAGLGLKGITIVISPLTALIDEQASRLEGHGYNVLTLHAGIDQKKQINNLKQFYNRELTPNFIFASPERISTDGLFEYCIKERRDEIKLIAVDEIHCVSQWGHSFRPFYKHIPTFLDHIYGNNWPTVLGLSATLNRKEITDICEAFHIEKKGIIKNTLLVRSEIELKALKLLNEEEKLEKLWQLLKIHQQDKVLVYVYRVGGKNSTEELAEVATSKGIKAVHFHGELSSNAKQDVIERFKDNDVNVVFATNAFGMGIDIPDIRVVIHFMIPESIAQYYQEVGRASRDQQASSAYLLYTNKNIEVKKTHFINKSFPTVDELKNAFSKMTSGKKGLHALPYFDDEEIQNCLPYFMASGLVEIVAKSIINLDVFTDVKDEHLKDLISLTRTKNMISTIKKSGKTAQEISSIVFEAIVNDQVKIEKSLGKCLIIYSHAEELDDQTLQQLEQYSVEKRLYKHELLDYFVYLLQNCKSSKEIHQEIGNHLGVPKFLLGRIYATTKGDLVRSKSEVIISNLLHQQGLTYEYEKELFYKPGERLAPDFTITINGQEIYWEHLGMIGRTEYDLDWLTKQSIYEEYFPGQLVVSYENHHLTDTAESIIQKILTK